MGLIARPYILPTDMTGVGGKLMHNIAAGVVGTAFLTEADVTYTAVTVGSFGDGISIEMVVDTDVDGYPLPNQPLSVSVIGKAITFHLATDEYAAIITTADDIVAAVADYETNPEAAALITASDSANTAQVEFGPEFLAGGTTLVADMTTLSRIIAVFNMSTPADITANVTEIVNGGFVLDSDESGDTLLVVWLRG